MSDTIHYGIIGCGMMDQEYLRNIALLPHTRVAAIYEPDAGMAAKALAPDAQLVASVSDLLEVQELDCLLIVSPNYCHVGRLDEI